MRTGNCEEGRDRRETGLQPVGEPACLMGRPSKRRGYSRSCRNARRPISKKIAAITEMGSSRSTTRLRRPVRQTCERVGVSSMALALPTRSVSDGDGNRLSIDDCFREFTRASRPSSFCRSHAVSQLQSGRKKETERERRKDDIAKSRNWTVDHRSSLNPHSRAVSLSLR